MFHPAMARKLLGTPSQVGNHQIAIFEAYKAIEVAVRKKGGFPTTEFGAALYEEGV